MLGLLHSSRRSTSKGFGLVIFSPIQESSDIGGMPRLEPIIRGNKCARTSRMEGRHVHMMLMLTSMVDHQATFQWSHVGFAELAKRTSDWSRRMETAVALMARNQRISPLCSSEGRGVAHHSCHKHNGCTQLSPPLSVQTVQLV